MIALGVALYTGFITASQVKQVTEVISAIQETQANMQLNAGSLDFNRFNSVGTSSQMAVGATSVQILATSSNRSYTRIGNPGPGPCWLNMNADKPATPGTGISLFATSTFAIEDINNYVGGIRAICPSGTQNLSVYDR